MRPGGNSPDASAAVWPSPRAHRAGRMWSHPPARARPLPRPPRTPRSPTPQTNHAPRAAPPDRRSPRGTRSSPAPAKLSARCAPSAPPASAPVARGPGRCHSSPRPPAAIRCTETRCPSCPPRATSFQLLHPNKAGRTPPAFPSRQSWQWSWLGLQEPLHPAAHPAPVPQVNSKSEEQKVQ
jgi:hypothetical protein